MLTVKQVRDRAHHYLSPDVAAAAGLTLQELQQFVAGTQTLSEDQLLSLARRMGESDG
jgi:hypothetical protein